jgi:hypothetical protein
MIITAMYLYGIIQHAWSFNIWHVLTTFIMDIILVRLLSPDIEIINKISDEERQYFKEKVIYLKEKVIYLKEKVNYFRKKWEVEELNRKILDKQLYG